MSGLKKNKLETILLHKQKNFEAETLYTALGTQDLLSSNVQIIILG